MQLFSKAGQGLGFAAVVSLGGRTWVILGISYQGGEKE